MLRGIAVVAVTCTITACGSTATSQGASAGALVGGLVDGWGGAAVGALIGGGVGYAVDASEANKRQQELRAREVAALENARISDNPVSAYRPANSNTLTGSTWRVISLVDAEKKTPGFKSMVLSFPTNTQATTLILWADGRAETFSESYMVVDDMLVFVGEDYVTNSKYTVQNGQMVIKTLAIRAVLEEIEESI